MRMKNSAIWLCFFVLAGCTYEKTKPDRIKGHRFVTTIDVDKSKTDNPKEAKSKNNKSVFWIMLTNASAESLCVTRIQTVPDFELQEKEQESNTSAVASELCDLGMKCCITAWQPGQVKILKLKKSFSDSCLLPIHVDVNYKFRINDKSPVTIWAEAVKLSPVPTALSRSDFEECELMKNSSISFAE